MALQIAQGDVWCRWITELGIHSNGVGKIFRHGVSTGCDYAGKAGTARRDYAVVTILDHQATGRIKLEPLNS